MKRRLLILLILSILLCLTLWLVSGWWLPFFQSWLPQLAGDIGNQIQSLEAFVALIVLIGGGIWGLWSWFARDEQANRRDDELSPLKPITWQGIRETYQQAIKYGQTDSWS